MTHTRRLRTSRLAAAVIALLAAGTARAMCVDGTTSTCIGASACKGTRECLGGRMTGCECYSYQCTTACGRPSYTDPVNGSCQRLPEICNGCDDDGNGQIDDSLQCQVPAFRSVCVAGDVQTSHGTSLLEVNGNRPDQYSDNMLWTERFFGNSQIRSVGLNFTALEVESNDELTIKSMQSGGISRITSARVPHQQSVAFNGLVPAAMELRFTTDAALATSDGWALTSLTVGCGGQTSSVVAADLSEDIDANVILTGDDDSVTFRIPPMNSEISIWTSSASPGLDVDLYIKPNAPPTRLDQASKSRGSSNEFLIRSSSTPLFVTVHSFTGKGVATIRFARNRPEAVRDGARPLRVGTLFIANGEQLDRISNALNWAQHSYFGMTEGRAQVRTVELWNQGANPLGQCQCGGNFCDVCISSRGGRSFCNPVTKNAIIFAEEYDGRAAWFGGFGIAHEWGHCLLGLPDEYKEHGVGACWHADDACQGTVMTRHTLFLNVCNALSHAKSTGGSSGMGHVCTRCTHDFGCTASCANCTIENTLSGWERLKASNLVWSAPLSTNNNNPYVADVNPYPFKVVRK